MSDKWHTFHEKMPEDGQRFKDHRGYVWTWHDGDAVALCGDGVWMPVKLDKWQPAAAAPTNHYDGDACWNALESAELAEPFALGCVIKYAWRYRHTRNTADLRKAIDYLERVIAMGEQ